MEKGRGGRELPGEAFHGIFAFLFFNLPGKKKDWHQHPLITWLKTQNVLGFF
jgi:hypothetical protein